MAAGKDYDAIGKAKLTKPSLMTKKPKLLVYSRNKKGKSTFCLSAGVGKVIFGDPEQGTAEMKKTDPDVFPVERWEDLDEYYGYLKWGKHSFEWAAVDGMTKIHNYALRFVMKTQEARDLTRQPGFVNKQDYGKANELVKEFLQKMHALPMGVIYTAQERQVENESGDDADDEAEGSPSAYIPDLPKGVRSSILAYVDVIGRLYVVRVPDKNDPAKQVPERRLWIGVHDQYDTGFRSEYQLPDMIKNPTVPKIVRLMRTGSTRVARKAS